MNSKYLILQVDIGPGTQWGDERTINPIREIFIPSVKNYCKKFNYKHLVITESLYEKKFSKFDFLATKSKHFSFERYFHFDNDFEYTIYLDNDVYIYSDSQPLPEFTGLRNVREAETNSSRVFREVNNLDNSYGYYNSGVTFCDNLSAKKLSKYMINRLHNNLRSKGKNSDNMLLNEFIIENKEMFSEIGPEWNYMPFLEKSSKIQSPNFFHFIGIVGKELINKLQEKKN